MQTTDRYFYERFIHERLFFCENFVLFGFADTLNLSWKWYFGRKWQFSGNCYMFNLEYIENHFTNEINLITDEKLNTYISIL
jgi:hypothetical protein